MKGYRLTNTTIEPLAFKVPRIKVSFETIISDIVYLLNFISKLGFEIPCAYASKIIVQCIKINVECSEFKIE